MLAVLLHLPEFVRRFESGIRALGANITRKKTIQYAGGGIDPTCLVSAGDARFEFRLGNALKEFLSVDREETPLRFDYGLQDPVYAEEKLACIVTGRLELARVMIESKTPEELKQRLEAIAGGFEKVRFWFSEEPEQKGGAWKR